MVGGEPDEAVDGVVERLSGDVREQVGGGI
jgi:hypothetical protein